MSHFGSVNGVIIPAWAVFLHRNEWGERIQFNMMMKTSDVTICMISVDAPGERDACESAGERQGLLLLLLLLVC